MSQYLEFLRYLQHYCTQHSRNSILVDSPTLVCWINPFVLLGVSGLFCHFCSIFDAKFCKQTMQTHIRSHIMWHLIWVCTVCQSAPFWVSLLSRLPFEICIAFTQSTKKEFRLQGYKKTFLLNSAEHEIFPTSKC